MNVATWLVPIVVALIGGISSYLGVSMTVKASYNKSMSEIRLEQEKQIVVIKEEIKGIKQDIQRLEAKQDKHNQVIERTYKLEQRMDDFEKKK